MGRDGRFRWDARSRSREGSRRGFDARGYRTRDSIQTWKFRWSNLVSSSLPFSFAWAVMSHYPRTDGLVRLYRVSVLQWLCNADSTAHSPAGRLLRFFTDLFGSLRKGSRAVFQFYPEGDEQVRFIMSQATKAGFGGGLCVDYVSLLSRHPPLKSAKRRSPSLKLTICFGVCPIIAEFIEEVCHQSSRAYRNLTDSLTRRNFGSLAGKSST